MKELLCECSLGAVINNDVDMEWQLTPAFQSMKNFLLNDIKKSEINSKSLLEFRLQVLKTDYSDDPAS